MSEKKYDLLPCPFCGSTVTFKDDGNIGNPIHIDCDSGDDCLGSTDLYPRRALPELLILWNTRAEKP